MTTKRILSAAVLTMFVWSASAYAQTVLSDPNARDLRFHGAGYGTVSTDVGPLVAYRGAGCGKVAVDAGTGDLTFISGTCGAEAAETAFECPIAAPLGGVIDVSDPACDTFGEVVDTINGDCTGCTTGKYLAVLVDALRSNSSNNTLATLASTDITTAKGLGLLKDTTVALDFTVSLDAPSDDIGFYIDETSGSGATVGAWRLNPNPWRNRQYRLIDLVNKFTGTGANTITVVCVKETLHATAAAQTARTIWTEAGAATTVQFTRVYPYLKCEADERLMVRHTAATTHTASLQFVAGASELAR